MTPQETKSGAAWLACAAQDEVDEFLAALLLVKRIEDVVKEDAAMFVASEGA